MKNFGMVGKGYHVDEKVEGVYTTGDRVKVRGLRGAFWGGLLGLFFGRVFLTIPVAGHVILFGYIAETAISATESALPIDGSVDTW